MVTMATVKQAHREVFERLIEDFKTYKPLMSAIKREYDLFILHQNDIIKELLPLQVILLYRIQNILILTDKN